jgi:transposase
MFIARSFWTNKAGKTYPSIWLRETFREDGKVKVRSLLNLKDWPDEAVSLLEDVLKNKQAAAKGRKGRIFGSKKHSPDSSSDLQTLLPQELLIEQGPSVGALYTVWTIAQRLAISSSLGQNQQAKLALWQICARVIEQGSRLSAVRMANVHAAASVIQFERGFTENDLYDNLDWLDKNQERIEDRLFETRSRQEEQKPHLFLYDVTSSYLEGEKNEYARFGYNRDKKKGKRQIVVGLLCDSNGMPVTVEVFDGNTQDVKTVSSQLEKIRTRFGCRRITFVGDRGMLKSASLSELSELEFSYITGITRAQIETLVHDGVLQYGLFDSTLCEAEQDGVRYVYRRNPERAKEIEHTREEKRACVEELVKKKNSWLSEHPRARCETALKAVKEKIEKVKSEKWLSVSVEEGNPRALRLVIDEENLEEQKRLDGCYVLKTNLEKSMADKEDVHARYKDLAYVERAFREMKMEQLELRPLHVRKKSSTRAHVLVVMLAYMITRELEKLWKGINLTVQEGLHSLSTLTEEHVKFPSGFEMAKIPTPSGQNRELLKAAGVELPPCLFPGRVDIRTHKKTRKIS